MHRLVSLTLAFALQLRKKDGKTSVRVGNDTVVVVVMMVIVLVVVVVVVVVVMMGEQLAFD